MASGPNFSKDEEESVLNQGQENAQRKKKVKSRKESFDANNYTPSVYQRVNALRGWKDYEPPKYKYLFSENYKPIEKLLSDRNDS